MNVYKAFHSLRHSLAREAVGIYRLPCRKAFLRVMLRGASEPLLFRAQENVCFRVDGNGLTVEKLRTGDVYMHFPWEQVESLAVGEPETDSGLLFQG